MLFFRKKEDFFQKKVRGSWNYEVSFLKLHLCLYLRNKFQVSNIILVLASSSPQTKRLKNQLILLEMYKRSLSGEENISDFSQYLLKMYFPIIIGNR